MAPICIDYKHDRQPSAFIAAFGTSSPPFVPTDRVVEVVGNGLRSAGHPEEVVTKFTRISQSSKIQSRSLNMGKYHAGTETERAKYLGKPAGVPLQHETPLVGQKCLTAQQRAALWDEIAPAVALDAARKALAQWNGSPADITHVITTCSSGWRQPGISTHLIHSLGLSLNSQKAELNFNGCFCGMTALRLARDVVRASEPTTPRTVLVVAVEVTSVHLDYGAADATSLVCYSLFADGAAAFVVSTDGLWRFTDAGMSLIPESRSLLGMVPHAAPGEPSRPGYIMTLNPEVPAVLNAYFTSGLGKELLLTILEKNCSNGGAPALAMHPGGPKILDSLLAPLQSLGFPSSALQESYDILFKHGNLGCAAVLFVLAEVFSSSSKDEVVSMAFGPGVTAEWGAFQRVKP